METLGSIALHLLVLASFLVLPLLPSSGAAASPAAGSLPQLGRPRTRWTFARPADGEELFAHDRSLYETRYFTQTLDHFNFNPQSYATFQQRYLVNSTHWGGRGSPIFVYTGNEGDVEMYPPNTGLMYESAPSFKALLVFIEHRYYGVSTPFKDANDPSTLGYLSTTQALADFATLITDLKKNLTSEESPVVVFGGSYGGMLAAWFRLKYPHAAIGALSSSAPILQLAGVTSQYTFYDTVTKDFKSESESCYRVIKNSWKELEDAMQTKQGLGKIEAAFKLCPNQQQKYSNEFEDWILSALEYGAMTDYPTAASYLTPLPAYPVKEMCKAIDNPVTGNDTFDRLYGAMNIYYNYTGDKTCFDLDSSDDSGIGYAQWIWQSCTELLLPIGASNDSMFPAYTYNYSARATFCNAYFGVPPRQHWAMTEFGGSDIKKVLKRFASNIIFFNGLRDPWSGGGVLESLSPTITAIVEPQGAHHVDLRFSTKDDPEWLRSARTKEVQIIKQWLDQYYEDSK